MRKITDGFDPESDSYLLTEYTFKGLYRLRETLAQKLDINPDKICDMATLYLLSQKRITEPELMQETVDINGKHATKDFEALFRDFTDEIK